MSEHSAKLRTYIEDYRSGLYSTNEAIGAVIELLVDAPDFKDLWAEVPKWAQTPILEFLAACHESSTIYNFSSKTSGPISPRLLELKRWLILEGDNLR